MLPCDKIVCQRLNSDLPVELIIYHMRTATKRNYGKFIGHLASDWQDYTEAQLREWLQGRNCLVNLKRKKRPKSDMKTPERCGRTMIEYIYL